MDTPSNGHEFLLGAYDALYEDIPRWVPDANRKSLEWDKTHLRRLVLTRGQRYITIDLPEFGRHFEQCLALGRFSTCLVPGFHKLVTKRGKDARPRLFWALTSRVFRRDGSLRESPCVNSISLIRQLCYLFKKIEGDCRDEYKFKAIGELYLVERELPEPSLDWEDPGSPYTHGRDITFSSGPACSRELAVLDGSSGSPSQCGSGFGDHLQRVFDILCGQVFTSFSAHEVRGRHGPGAVSDRKGESSKYDFPSWPAKLDAVFPFDWHASTNHMVDGTSPCDREVASKLICVPKTQKGPRLIAAEPICNQWIQQGMMDYVIDRFRKSVIRHSVRIEDQGLNQERAMLASFGDLATIDLSSASDRLSCYVVERALRVSPDFLSAVMACRTSHLSNELDKKQPKLLKIKKFAMMGSALTFPMQSFVFFGVTIACDLWVRGMRPSLKNIERCTGKVSVYGDDIIVPVGSCSILVQCLTALGLKVNVHKSFWTGKFRESCGTDWYEGQCVTVSYIKADFDPTRPSTLSKVVECSNNFYRRGLWSVSSYLTSRIPKRALSKIAIEDGSMAIKGLFSYTGVKLDHLRKRFNENYQRWEYKVVNLFADLMAPRPDGIARLRQYFTESPDPTIKWDPRTSGRSVPVLRERYAPLYSGV